jgi:hypothetical protein
MPGAVVSLLSKRAPEVAASRELTLARNQGARSLDVERPSGDHGRMSVSVQKDHFARATSPMGQKRTLSVSHECQLWRSPALYAWLSKRSDACDRPVTRRRPNKYTSPHTKSVTANSTVGTTPTYVKPYATRRPTAAKRNMASQ